MRQSATSLTHWRNLLRDRFAIAEPWLKPTDQYASHIPKLGSDFVWYRVIEDTPYVYIAVDEEQGCRVDVQRCEMVIHQFDFGRLVACLSAHFGFDIRLERRPNDPAWLIGVDSPLAGVAFPVFLQCRRISDAVLFATDHSDGPFVLIQWGDEPIDDRTRRRLEGHDALLLTLDQFASLDERGELALAGTARNRLKAFRNYHSPNIDAAKPNIGFATPAGCTWPDVSIRFVDQHTVRISVRDETGIYLYSQMGLVDARNRQPTKQWDLLADFAKGYGLMTWNSPAACRKNKKRREVLSATLRDFFRISGDPIELTEDKKGWRCVFRIEPES
ncbi:hypothetical protein [Novipirellula artificiosorum]|uniref:Uncharacterized protein n=1 Tax=Novipirellula artificiosorum TaxID=2528016 RepID=A0A5C6DX18_9BACT|nr:hypothetical protein [Novipirellula artificiosorum]TWU39359.1 hypothetical protein Poly41_21830 [Novipirellula artificiosorum]